MNGLIIMDARARRDWYTHAQRALLARLREAASAGAGIILSDSDGEAISAARSLRREGLVTVEEGIDETGAPEHRVTLI